MTERIITKALITQEDLALGQGSITQSRQGISQDLGAIDLPWVVTSIIEVQRLDTAKYSHCTYVTNSQVRFYRFAAASAETVDNFQFIAPNEGSGQWVLSYDAYDAATTVKERFNLSLVKYPSISEFILTTPDQSQVYIQSYLAGWAATTAGPKGSFTLHKTGGTNVNPTEGTAVSASSIGGFDGTGSTTGQSAQHGYFWTADGTEWKRNYTNKVNPFQYGAVGNGSTDDTKAFNEALQADKIYADVNQVELDLEGGDFVVLGAVWVRKGQTISGGGAHVFMSATGSFKLGYRSDDTQDGGGAPVTLNDIWMEGGSNPIIALIPGYTIRNVFASFPASGCIFSGSDGVIADCIFDNASTAVTFSARNSIMHGCDFYVSNTQMFIGSEDSVISACTFNYAAIVAIDWASTTVKNTRVIGCSFVKNAQDSSTFQGYVRTRNVTTAPVGDLTFSDCTFRNCFGAAIKNYGTSAHRLVFKGCEFNGLKTNVNYAQSTTMYALDMLSAAARGTTEFIDCDFKELLATPIQINTNEACTVKLKDLDFENCAGTTSISIAGGNTQNYEISNINGDNKDLLSITNSPNIQYFGYMKNWLEIKDDGTDSYIEIPFVDPMVVELLMTANANPGANVNYRFAEKNIASITYDFAGGVVSTVATVKEIFKANTGIGADFAISAAVDTIATGTSKATALTNGKLVLYWTNAYANERINVNVLL